MHQPQPLSLTEWREICHIKAIREMWGLTDETTPEDFAGSVYGVKFDFVSGSPGYVGEVFILQGDCLTGDPPVVLIRDEHLADEEQPHGYLTVINYYNH